VAESIVKAIVPNTAIEYQALECVLLITGITC
jgi:hypothetical protein